MTWNKFSRIILYTINYWKVNKKKKPGDIFEINICFTSENVNKTPWDGKLTASNYMCVYVCNLN